jgi:hypothetical protein
LLVQVRSLIICLALAGGLATGCNRGPEQGTVTGRVTLDGRAVDGGMIRFVPADGATQPGDSPLTAGAYTVTMQTGAKKVEVYWGRPKGSAVAVDTASQGNETIIETIPRKYNSQTELSYDIAPGEQVKDFPLTTD